MADENTSPALALPDALRQYGHLLTIYEKKEIEDYKVIYYAGQKCSKKIKAPTSGPNDGYDNEDGEYMFVNDDHIAYRYQVDCLLGVGAFGQVLRARDHLTGTFVAVKLIRNKKKIAQQSKEEIRILQHINDKDTADRYGLVRMHEHFVFRNHVCIVYELLGENLYDEMKANDFFPMSLVEVRTIAARLLVSLTFLWRENIIHADLKPENVLRKCNNSTIVKVADLGSACYDGKTQYSYIQSRFYRAPEIILGNVYGKPIDLWSYACILCELATGYPLFPGENERDQLACIMEYLDVPPKEIVDRSRRFQKYFRADYTAKIEPTSKGRMREPGGRQLHKFLGLEMDDNFVSFLEQFLVWDPDERVPPREAMKHPWIREEFIFDRSQVPPAPPVTPPARKMITGDRPERPSGPTRTLDRSEPALPSPAAATTTTKASSTAAPLNCDGEKEKEAAAELAEDSAATGTARLKRPAVSTTKARSLQGPMIIPAQAAGTARSAVGALPAVFPSAPVHALNVPTASRRGSGDAAGTTPGRVATLVQKLDNAALTNTTVAAAQGSGTAPSGPVGPRNSLQRVAAQPTRSTAEPTVRRRSLDSEPTPKASNASMPRVVPAARNGTQAFSNNTTTQGSYSPTVTAAPPTNGSTMGAAMKGVSLSRDSAIVQRSSSPFYAPSAFDTPLAHQPLFGMPTSPPAKPLAPPPMLEPRKIGAPRRERRVDLSSGNKTGVLVKELSPGTRRRAQARTQRRISDAVLAPDMSDANPTKGTLPTIR